MATQGLTVLIVDDNEMNRDTLARRLRQQGCQYDMAVNGREALNMIMLDPRKYDLILLDIMMPEVDGYTVLSRLKADEQLKNLPVIMISAVEEMESVMKCMELGADDYLTKPLDPNLLKAAVERCLRSKLASTAAPAPPVMPPLPPPRSLADPLEDSAATAPNAKPLTIAEVAARLINMERVSRKGYLYFSKTIFNTMYAKKGLSPEEREQIFRVFDEIVAGKIKVVD
ncbi:MAG: response regulator [Pseudanabaenaceae cyanobacterium]